MVVVALVLRLAVVTFLYPERTDPARDHSRCGGEAGRIARSIVQGEGFSNPFFGKTGPTAWLAPVFPYLLAGIFKAFGVYSKASAIAALALDCLFSALTCIPVYFIASKNFGVATAQWAGWVWGLFPYAVFFSADFIWATTLTTLLMSLVFLTALHLESSSSLWHWAGFGALSGLGALTDPVVMSVAPFLGVWARYRLYKNGRRWLAPGLAAVFAVTLTLAPWFIRNYETFHKLIPFRSCLGLEVTLATIRIPGTGDHMAITLQTMKTNGESINNSARLPTPKRSFTKRWHSLIRIARCMLSRRCGVVYTSGPVSGVSAHAICKRSRLIHSIWCSLPASQY